MARILILLIFALISVTNQQFTTTRTTSRSSINSTPRSTTPATTRTTTTPASNFSYEANCTLEFELFKVKYAKRYANASNESYHKEIFCKTLKMVIDNNSNSSSFFKLEINEHSDIDPALNPKGNGLLSDTPKGKKVQSIPIPPKKNKKVGNNGYLNYLSITGPVMDQGKCGTCWSFATVAVLQADAKRRENKNLRISPQAMNDCSTDGANCGGGRIFSGLDFAHEYGSYALASYPYNIRNNKCRLPNPKIPSIYNSTKTCVANPGTENSYKDFLDAYGPACLGVAANGTFYSYAGGIYTASWSCGYNINHAVTLIGYGFDAASGLNYWIIKNSWGPNWGENGTMRIQAGVGMCGIGNLLSNLCN